MENFVVKRDKDRDLKFTGEKLGAVSSSPDHGRPNFSGSVGRGTELTLYRTKGGKFICGKLKFSCHDGERNHHSGAISETEAEVFEFFGQGWLSKELYENAGMDSAIEVE